MSLRVHICVHVRVRARVCACIALSPQQGRLWVCGAEPSRRRAPHGAKWQPPGRHWLMTVKTLAVNVKWATRCHSEALHLWAAVTTAQQSPLQLDSAVLQQNNKRKAPQIITTTTSGIWSTQQRGEEQDKHRHSGFFFLHLNSSGQEWKSRAVFEWRQGGEHAVCLDCHWCQPRSDKVRSRCLESYRSRGQLCGGGVKEGVTKREHHHRYPSLNEAT